LKKGIHLIIQSAWRECVGHLFPTGCVIIIHFEEIDLMEHGGEYDSCEQRAFSIIRAQKRGEKWSNLPFDIFIISPTSAVP
jgi:hypothetical protein